MSPRPRSASDDEILAAGARAVVRAGIARVTLADIAGDCGLTAPSVVERWGGKQQILLALAERAVRRAGEELHTAREAMETATDAVVGGLTAMVPEAGVRQGTASERLALLRMSADPDFHAHIVEHNRVLQQEIHSLLEEAIAEGDLRPCDTEHLARVLGAVTTAALLSWIPDDSGDTLRGDLEAILAPHRRSSSLDATRGVARRRERGQHTTPATVAEDMARLGLEFLNGSAHGADLRVLDPAVGAGALVAALLRVAPERPASVTGVELDARLADAARELWGVSGLEVIEGDFTCLSPAGSSGLVLANPPYTRHHGIPSREKHRLQRLIRERLGIDVGGLAGLHLYMVLLADAWMDDDATAVWILPAEWLVAVSGSPLRRYLREQVTLLRLHTWDPEEPLFRDAAVASTVIAFRKTTPPGGHRVAVTHGGTLGRPREERLVPLSEFTPDRRWPPSRTVAPGADADVSPPITVGDLFRVQRGIATGRNRFYVRPYADWRAMEIPEDFLRPILPSPRALPVDVVEEGPDGYPALDTPLALLDCRLAPEVIEAEHPALVQYLQSEEGLEARSGYLSRSRSIWYMQERRAPSPILVAGMGRQRNGTSSLRCILNHTRAVASNSWILLYPVDDIATRLEQRPELLMNVVEALRDTIEHHHDHHGRTYGGGLRKLEPGELMGIPAGRIINALFGSTGK